MTHAATVRLDSQHHVGEIDRRIFGGFAEHLGRCIYEGIYDPGSPLADENGFRTDVLGALKRLDMPVMRYPGGNFVSAYNWEDGVGPRDARPKRPDFAWRSVENNQFGTDEFMQWAKQLGTAPMMAVNLGTRGAEAAGNLLEYCNFSTDTKYANLRREHGHAEPYDVKLWCLGNEMDGPWQAGHVPAHVYARRAREAGALMKGLDPTIETVACGSSALTMPTYLAYDREVLEYAWDQVDYVSAHRYSENYHDETGWFLAEGVEIDRVLDDYAGLLAYVRGMKKSAKQVYVSFDEWNVWYRAREGDAMDGHWTEAPPLLEEQYNLEDAIVCAQYLSAFIRRADLVKIACIAQVVNVIAPLLTKADGLLVQSIFHPFEWFSKHARGKSLRPAIESPTYDAGKRGEVPALDVSATFDESANSAAVFLVNRNHTTDLTVTVEFDDLDIASIEGVDLLGGGDVKATNTWENPDAVKPQGGKAESVGRGVKVTVPAPGLAVVRLKVANRA